MKPLANTPSAPGFNPSTRQPLLWAALAFSSGIFLGSHLWRPPVWWLIAGVFFTISGAYFIGRRSWAASALSFSALVAAGAFAIQVLPPADFGDSAIWQFTDGREVVITAHVIREGFPRQEAFDNTRRALDVETEQIESAGNIFYTRSGLRVSFYSKEALDEDENLTTSPPTLRYGARLRFTAKLFAPRNFGNPGAFDYRGYLQDHGIAALGSAKTTSVEPLPGFTGNRLELWRTRIHRRIIEKIHALWPAAEASLVDAMVIGEDAFLGQDTRTEFQRSGTYHVLVVSGMNVGILAFVAFWILKGLHVNDLAAGLITVALAVAYAFLTDVGPPIWRATLMLTIYLATRLLYRERSMLNAVGAAALGLLIFDPKALLGASFQLTFLCVLLIAGVGVPLLERTSQPYRRGLHNLRAVNYDRSLPPRVAQFRLDLRAIANRFAPVFGKRLSVVLAGGAAWIALAGYELLFISAVMQLGLALPMAYYFHRATVVGLPANMLVVPLTEIMMPAAVLAIVSGFISMTAARIPALMTSLTLHAIAGSVRWLGGLRVADTRIPTPVLAVILFSCAAVTLAILLARRRALIAGAGLAALAASAFWIAVVPPRPQFHAGSLEVTAIDVGQGDAIFLVSPDGRTLLVDAGGAPVWMQSGLDTGESVVSPYLWSRGIGHIDAIAITHAHADHMGGMRAILANFRPRELWIGVDSLSPAFQAIIQQARDAGVSIVSRKAGDAFDFGQASIRVLAPAVDPQSRNWRQNDDSLAIRIAYGHTAALLEGDAERQTEKQIAKEEPQADLLKVAHHGSATSTIPELLTAVQPHFAIISVGARNVYGHPRKEVLDRLQQAGVVTYRTDLDGAVTFYLDGKNVSPHLATQY
jgi:competence protein ComEC